MALHKVAFGLLAMLFAGFVLAANGAVRAQEQPAAVGSAEMAERTAAARDLMEAMGVTKQLDGMIAAMSQGFAQGAKADESEKGKKMSAEFDALMQKFLGYKDEMMNDFAMLYAENFTAAEMKEVAQFYRSGTGAKFVAAMPGLMEKGAKIGMKYSQRLQQDAVDAAAKAKK